MSRAFLRGSLAFVARANQGVQWRKRHGPKYFYWHGPDLSSSDYQVHKLAQFVTLMVPKTRIDLVLVRSGAKSLKQRADQGVFHRVTTAVLPLHTKPILFISKLVLTLINRPTTLHRFQRVYHLPPANVARLVVQSFFDESGTQ